MVEIEPVFETEPLRAREMVERRLDPWCQGLETLRRHVLGRLRKVGHDEQLLIGVRPQVAEQMRVARLDDLHAAVVERGELLPQELEEPGRLAEEPPLDGVGVGEVFAGFPAAAAAVDPPAIAHLPWVMQIGVIVDHPVLVAGVEQRHPTDARLNAHQQRDAPHRAFDELIVLALERIFEPCER